MKRLMILCFCLAGWLFAGAQEGVDFRDIALDEALARAKAESKLVFMDCYTSWCGPCKNMANKVFTQKAAGDYFNPRFVCVKYDMEKGEGVELAKKYDVHAYPTFVILRPDGAVQHRLVGGDALEAFIARVEAGLNEETSLLAKNRAYAEGKMTSEELMAYQEALADAGEETKAAEVYGELLELLSDEEKTQKAYWGLYTDRSCAIGTPMFDFLLAHLPAIRRNVGEETVDKYLYRHYAKILENYIAGYAKEDAVPVGKLKEQINGFRIKGQENLEQMLALAEPVSRKDIDKVAAMTEEKIPQAGSGELSMYAFGFRTILWKTEEPYPAAYAKYGKKLLARTISEMEKRGTALTLDDLQNYAVSLSCFGEPDKKECQRLVALGDKLLPTLAGEKKRHVEWLFGEYRKKLERFR